MAIKIELEEDEAILLFNLLNEVATHKRHLMMEEMSHECLLALIAQLRPANIDVSSKEYLERVSAASASYHYRTRETRA